MISNKHIMLILRIGAFLLATAIFIALICNGLRH